MLASTEADLSVLMSQVKEVVMAGKKESGGKKTRKYGRNTVKCSRYAVEHRRLRRHGRTGIDGPLRQARPSESTPH